MISQDSSQPIDTLSNYHCCLSHCGSSVVLSTIAGNLCHSVPCQLSFSISFELPMEDSSPTCPACSSAQHSRVPTAWDMQMLPQPLKRRNNDRKQSRENPGAPAGKHHLKTLERRESDYKQHGLKLANKKYISYLSLKGRTVRREKSRKM